MVRMGISFRFFLDAGTLHREQSFVEFDRLPLCRQSGEQHGESRALVVIALTDPQFAADLFDQRPNDPHAQSLAGGWIKSLRQTWAIIGN